MLPKDSVYGGWPTSGEIDIMESRGNAIYPGGGGLNSVASTLHWGPPWGPNQWHLTHKEYELDDNSTFNDDFYTFGLLWQKDRLVTYLNTPGTSMLCDLHTGR